MKTTIHDILHGVLSLLPSVGQGVALVLLMFLASCSSDDSGGGVTDGDLTTLQLYVSVPALPATEGTRIGDPGTDPGEGEDWDKLAIMIEYTEGEDGQPYQRRILRTFTAEQFNNLPSWDEAGKIKKLSFDLPKGIVSVYGVTYTEDAVNGIDGMIEAWGSGNVEVGEMTISNDYASNGDVVDTQKFLSVATGYIEGIEIGPVVDAETSKPIQYMTLTRLAAKIDIQWDAQGAYEPDENNNYVYNDVTVSDFTFSCGNDKITDSGSGRLFPTLYTGNDALSGTKSFFNQTEVSKRNGRVYHYVYPDGVSTPKVTFNITAKGGNDETADVDKKPYTFNFGEKLQQSTWYYIRTFINGFNGQDTNITITREDTN